MTRSPTRILDEFLVVAARTGDRQAFGALARRWNGKLTAHAWRLTGDPEMARDATQEAWVEMVRGLQRLTDEGAFPAWAYRIVSRRCAKLVGSAIRRRDLVAEVATEPEAEVADPGVAVHAGQLRAAIARLPPDQRSAIALFYLEDMSVAEVAVALDAPLGTVKTRLLHARRKLRAAMEGD